MSYPTDIAAMIGKRYNRLTVLSGAGVNVNRYKMVLCRCDCGAEKEIEARVVFKGITKSCGCLQRDMTAATYRKRGRGNSLDAIDEDIIG